MLSYRHVCLNGASECDDDTLLGSPRVRDAVDGLLEEFSEFFRRVTGSSLWVLQRSWARRMLAGESFALIAPTGVGKSTLLQVYGLHRALAGEVVLYVVPTRSLVQQVTERLRALGGGTGVEVRNDLALLRAGVSVVTHMLLFRERKALELASVSTVIVDDFDALLKSSSLLSSILLALGFAPEDVEVARNLVKLKRSASILKRASPEHYRQVTKSIEELEARLANSIGGRRVGQLLIASATGRGRRERVRVLAQLLNFEIGSIVDYLRNVREFSAPLDGVDLRELVEELGRGTLVFVSRDLGRGYVRRLVEELGSGGIRVGTAHTPRAIERLRRGEVDVLVGVATYYGVLTRGIDEPTLIRSSVFVGVPKFSLPLDAFLSKTSYMLLTFRALAADPGREPEALRLYESLSRLRPSVLKIVDLCLAGFAQPNSPHIEELVNRASELRDYLKRLVKSRTPPSGRLMLGNAVARYLGSDVVVEIPDVYTYVQGSGRTSRLLNGRMTVGVSVLLYEDGHIYEAFLKRLRRLFESGFRDLEPDGLSEALRQAEESRSSSSGSGDTVSRIVPALLIVESPTKAKTIARMFGGGGKRYLGGVVAYEAVIPVGQTYYVSTIVPSLGHVFDLATDTGIYGVEVDGDGNVRPVYTSLKRCRECGHQFTDELGTCPRCGSPRVYDSVRTINVMRKLAKESSIVVIATDADEEGEKIAYDIYVSLRPYNDNVKRAEFREITRHGVVEGMSSLREVDASLVKSQVVRRVDDRLVGFELSSVLRERLGEPNVGGGRVQTPVLSWVVERYEEYARSRKFVVSAELPYEGLAVRIYADSEEEAARLHAELERGVEVVPLSEEVEVVHPKPPYTTDTALEELGKSLRLAPGEVMRVLQDLYEAGFITYHRTPSTRVSSYGMEIARAYLSSVGLQHLFAPRSWGEGGAHEAIRPTRPLEDVESESLQLGLSLTRKHYEAYRLVFTRFVASQMAPSKLLTRTYSLRLLSGEEVARVRLPVRILEEGFARVRPPKLVGLPDEPAVVKPASVKRYRGSPVGLMTTAEAVRRMREEGIGRPSTYAKAIENNRRHGYAVISRYRQCLVPTKKGVEVLRVVREVSPQLATSRYTARLMRFAERVDRDIPYELAILVPLSSLAEMRLGSAARRAALESDQAGLRESCGEAP